MPATPFKSFSFEEFKTLSPADAKAISEIWARNRDRNDLKYDEPAAEQIRDILDEVKKEPERFGIIVRDRANANKVVGFAVANFSGAIGNIDNQMVDLPYSNRGIGTKLQQILVRKLAKHGCKEIYVIRSSANMHAGKIDFKLKFRKVSETEDSRRKAGLTVVRKRDIPLKPIRRR